LPIMSASHGRCVCDALDPGTRKRDKDTPPMQPDEHNHRSVFRASLKDAPTHR
jgi:hypothetical protein